MGMEYLDLSEWDRIHKEFADSGDILIIDTETTGLDCDSDEILSLSIYDYNSQQPLLDTFLWPHSLKRWPEAQRINHISYDMVRDAPSIQQKRDAINDTICNEKILIAYNNGFDLPFLRRFGICVDAPSYELDVMLEFAAFFGEFNSYYGDPMWQKLSYAAEVCGYTGYDPHISMEDCKVTAFILDFMTAHPELYGRMVDTIDG